MKFQTTTTKSGTKRHAVKADGATWTIERTGEGSDRTHTVKRDRKKVTTAPTFAEAKRMVIETIESEQMRREGEFGHGTSVLTLVEPTADADLAEVQAEEQPTEGRIRYQARITINGEVAVEAEVHQARAHNAARKEGFRSLVSAGKALGAANAWKIAEGGATADEALLTDTVIPMVAIGTDATAEVRLIPTRG